MKCLGCLRFFDILRSIDKKFMFIYPSLSSHTIRLFKSDFLISFVNYCMFIRKYSRSHFLKFHYCQVINQLVDNWRGSLLHLNKTVRFFECLIVDQVTKFVEYPWNF